MSLPPDNSAHARRINRAGQRPYAGAHRGVQPGARRRRRGAQGRARYSLTSERTGAPLARLKPTEDADTVQVLWRNGQRWAAPGPFGIATMSLGAALDHIASELHFWINA